MEIEIRAKITKPKEIINLLKKDRGAILISEKEEKDIYYKHSTDTERKLVLRIRKTKSGAMLTFKSKSKGDDTAWPDVDLPLGEPKTLENILRSSNYEEVVRITKKRLSFSKQGFEINIDHIKELGWFIEIEGRGTHRERKRIENELTATLQILGVHKDEIVRQGYVPLALAKQGMKQ